MSKSVIKRMKAQMALYTVSDESMDTMIIGAIMEELCGARPEGTAEAMEAKQNKRTGYTFPHNRKLKADFKDMLDADTPEDLLQEIDEHTAVCDQLIKHYKGMH